MLCHSHISFDPDIAGWVYRGESSIGVWGRFYPDEGKGGSFDRAAWEREQREEKRRRKKACKNALNRDDRDKSIRQLHRHIYLSRVDRDRLRNRGLTDEQIDKGLFFSKGKYQDIPKGLPYNLPGIDSKHKNMSGKDVGIVCPIFDFQGRAIGWQLRLRNATKNKYKWAYSYIDGKHISSDLPNGEKPITIIKTASRDKTLYLAEGFLKPYIAAHRHHINVAGSPNGQFSGAPKQIQEILSLGYERLVICPDAGDVVNPQTMTRWRRQIDFLNELGLEIQVAWWGQFSKENHADIDEIANLDDLDFLSTSEFLAMGDRFSNELWQKWNESRKFTPHHKFEAKFFNYSLPAKNTILAVKSDMGTGKTTQLVEWIKELEKKHGIISLGYRNTLLYQYSEKTNSYHIHEKEARMMIADERSKIALCVDSLLKFEPEDFNNRVIVLDEVTSVIPHLLTSSTIPEYNRDQIINLFGEAIKRANRVILLDGNMRDWVVDFVAQYAPDKQVIKVENTFKANQDRKIIFYPGTITYKGKINNRDLSVLREKALASRRPMIVLDNQAEAEVYDQFFTSQGLKTLRVDRTTSGKNEIKEFLTDCDAYIQKHQPDAVIMTPSAESGVDISIKNYFSDIFVFAYGAISVGAIRQISTRLRDKNAQMHVWANSRPRIKSELDIEDLIKEIIEDIRFHKFRQLSSKDAEKIKEILRATAAKEKKSDTGYLQTLDLAEKYFYIDCLKTSFIEAGFVIEEFVGKSNKLINQEFSEVKKSIYIERSVAIFNAPDISEEQLNYPQKFNASPEEIYARQKATIKKLLPGIELTDIWNPDFIYQTQFKHPDYINTINTKYLYDHPELAKQLNSKALAKRYRQAGVIENMSLRNLRLRGLTALKLREAGLEEVFKVAQTQDINGKTPEVIAFHKKLSRSPALRRTLGIKNLNKHPIHNLNRVLKYINLSLESYQVHDSEVQNAVRYYRLKVHKLDKKTHDICYDLCSTRWQKWIANELEKAISEVEKKQKKVDYSAVSQLLQVSQLASLANAYGFSKKNEGFSAMSEVSDRFDLKIRDHLLNLRRKILKEGFQNERCCQLKSQQEMLEIVQHCLIVLAEFGWHSFLEQINLFGDFMAYKILCFFYHFGEGRCN